MKSGTKKEITVIGLGAGGHAAVVIEILQFDEAVQFYGLLDPKPELLQKLILGVPVIGGDERLKELKAEGVSHFFVGVGSIGPIRQRRRLFSRAIQEGLSPVNAVHPKAILSGNVQLGEGIAVMAGAIINTGVRTGLNVIINTGAIVEHDCQLADHTHVATGAHLAGTVHVGPGAHIGVGATILQNITIGEGSIVGAGAVVVKDVLPRTLVVGVPARTIRSLESGRSLSGR